MIRSSSRGLAAAAAIAALMTAGGAHAFTEPTFNGTDTTIGSPGYPAFWNANLIAPAIKPETAADAPIIG